MAATLPVPATQSPSAAGAGASSAAAPSTPFAANSSATLAGARTVIGRELHVGISGFGSWMLGVGTIIGSMAWLFHAPMIARAGTMASMAAFLAGALISLPLAVVLSELSRLVPSAGGPYVYKYLAFKKLFPRGGEFLGFSSGWLFWVALVAGYACMANGLSGLLAATFWGSASAAPVWFGPVCISVMFVLTTAMNLFPISKVSGINSLFTLMKFALAAGFVAVVFASGKFEIARVLHVTNPAGEGNLWTNLSSVLIFGIAAYSGLELSACASSETSRAERNVPRAILLTLVSVASIYFFMSVCVAGVAEFVRTANGASAVVRGTNVPATCPGIAGMLAGNTVGALFTFGVVASIVGCGIGGLLSCARIIFAIAKTGLFPQHLAEVNERKVPANALWFQCAVMTLVGVAANLLSRCGLFPDAYTFLAEVFAFLYSFLAIFYGVSLLVLGARNARHVVPALMVIGIYFALAFFCVSTIHQMCAAVLLVLGVPLHLLNKKQQACSR